MKKCTSILDNQFEIMLGRSAMEAIHLKRQMIEYYRLKKETCTRIFYWLSKSIHLGIKRCTLVDNNKE